MGINLKDTDWAAIVAQNRESVPFLRWYYRQPPPTDNKNITSTKAMDDYLKRIILSTRDPQTGKYYQKKKVES
jgi:hypothetical protein